jgi:hypothetical protein
MPRALRTSPDDDLGLPWERLGDGRVWRLKRGQHYEVDTKALTRAAEVAAVRMGKVACVTSDRIPRIRHWDDYAWIQFVDHAVTVGDPCPCGCREFIRRHPRYGHCLACGAHLMLTPPPEEEQFTSEGAGSVAQTGALGMTEAQRAKAIVRGSFRHYYDERYPLEEYGEVLFVARERSPRRERLYGRAVDPLGMPVLIWVQYPLRDGNRIPDEAGGPGVTCRVHRWPIPPFSSLIDARRAPSPETEDLPAEGSFGSAHHRGDRRGRGRLSRFSRVSLVYQEELPGRERHYGHALDQEGAPALIYVDYPLLGGTRVRDPDDAKDELHQVYRWPIAPFGAMIDLGPLER